MSTPVPWSAVGLLTSVTVGALSGALILTWRRVRAAEQDQATATTVGQGPFEAIVVFGAAVNEQGPCRELRARLDHAEGLWRLGVARRIIVSGGMDGHLDETSVMRQYLLARGVPDSALWEGRPGDNTRLTLRTLTALHGAGRGATFVAVSSPFHAYRIRVEARRQGLPVLVDCFPVAAGASTPRMLRVRRQAEVLGVILYALPEVVATPLRRAVGSLRHTIPDALARPRA